MPKVQSIEVDFPDEVLLKLALLAHNEDLTLNQFVSNILRDKLYEEKVRVLEQKVRVLEGAQKKGFNPGAPYKWQIDEPKAAVFQSELKVGDIVRVLPVPASDAGAKEWRPRVGSTGAVEYVDPDTSFRGEFVIKVNGIWYRPDELTLIRKASDATES